MEIFTSEVLHSGIKVTAIRDHRFRIEDGSVFINLTASDINRLHGIAFPEKRRTGECSNTPEATDVPDTNVGDIPQPTAADKYEENVRKLAEEATLAYIQGARDFGFDETPVLPNDPDLINHLIERGLIPAPECQHHYIMCGYNEFQCEFCGQRK